MCIKISHISRAYFGVRWHISIHKFPALCAAFRLFARHLSPQKGPISIENFVIIKSAVEPWDNEECYFGRRQQRKKINRSQWRLLEWDKLQAVDHDSKNKIFFSMSI